MNNHPTANPNPGLDRLHELLADRATQGLAADQQAEMDRLLADHREVDAAGLDRTAAAIDLALHDEDAAPLPDELRKRIEAAAADTRAKSAGLSQTPGDRARRQQGTGPAWRPWLPPPVLVLGLAAACLTLAVWAWWPTDAPPLSRDELIAGGAVVVPWNDNDAGIGGDVVWSSQQQQGYLRFTGLQPNDASVEQYQLWIFDATRDAQYPVDGGVFDSTTAQEVVVRIDPRLSISKATLFAVTIEKPGGVVVSDRSRLILAASPGDV